MTSSRNTPQDYLKFAEEGNGLRAIRAFKGGTVKQSSPPPVERLQGGEAFGRRQLR